MQLWTESYYFGIEERGGMMCVILVCFRKYFTVYQLHYIYNYKWYFMKDNSRLKTPKIQHYYIFEFFKSIAFIF
jgi:hypothetical protein